MKASEIRALNPRQISRLSEKDARAAYQQLRNAFKRQSRRLSEKGYKRPVTAANFPPMSQLDADEIKTQLQELTYWSRRGDYRLSAIQHQQTKMRAYMQKVGFEDTSPEVVEKFTLYLKKLKDKGLLSRTSPNYSEEMNRINQMWAPQNNAELLKNSFQRLMRLEDQGYDLDTILAMGGQTYGLSIDQVAAHKKVLQKYGDEIRELLNDQSIRVRSNKELDNLIRRARRRYNKKQ